MARFDLRNNSLRLLSLLLAFALWLYVSNEQNPLREKVLTINLEETGLSQNLIITGGMPETVKVRVQGNRNQLTNLSPVDFKAVVNIPEGKTGDFSVPVQVSTPTGLRVAQVIPDQVNLSVDRIVEKQITVAVSLRGTPAEGFTALAPVYQPNIVVARGPSRDINSISQATALVDIQAAAKDVDQTIQVNVGSANVTINPAVVHVTIPIVSAVANKTVPVAPQVSGSPAAGYAVKRQSAEPATVQLSGAAEALSAITSIKTEPVDIQGADKNITKEVGLTVPQGVSAQPGRVKVTVEVVKSDSAATPSGDSDTTKPKT
ncbi:CdaR family protein [Pelotomaculum propionicicum]|uniref:CdaA regulatory protein CdaR n=1 Tax=Pelotomaculum propionicicum TaxID=258475 RepID=A0A4Y7RY09_9FIRM|nr:CdaR family protein [Pelotomaculum propionicicum]NLI13321.1 hypothetical protein [Peptococcaceae bacterium]TEB13187.1 CdaA regulatory protein CdaR [Pelotomaculum propionicicum]